MPEEISKLYEFSEVEEKITARWLDGKAFRAQPDERENRYVIMMPLPNVTGALHMGHAMDNVMQDLLIRWHRMKGDNTLWQPGTDHAGIATQAVVEKRLFELEGKTRHDIGREELVKRIWEWTDKCQSRIVAQQQRMGCSCDWDRQRFTMDAVCRAAVRECFFRLFKDKLVFRGYRLVNWDCFLQTAVSDDEIVVEEVQGHFWHLRYPVMDPREGEPEYVVVATTRPETMLGDTAVACHPDPEGELDRLIAQAEERVHKASSRERPEAEAALEALRDRRKKVLPSLLKLRDMARDGRMVMLPLMERPIPLILDEWAKPGMGSGCVKITPAHDPNDYEVWTRHKDSIDIINILNVDGKLNDKAGRFEGLDMSAARDAVLDELDKAGLVEKVEDRLIPIGHSDRSKTPIEPFLSRQWFVRMGDVEGGLVMGRGTANEFRTKGLAQAAMDAVSGEWRSPTGRKLVFHPDPERYAGTYLAWLGEKRDWCISRQLWWGHRIPIWSAELEKARLKELARELSGEADSCFAWIVTGDGDGGLLALDETAEPEGEGPFELQLCLRDEEAEKRLQPVIERFGLERDPDVLDTWFSSALWPFSTLGWPDPSAGLENDGQASLADQGHGDALSYYYPGSCLVTGRDIITLWVARMVIMGLYNLGDLPFTDCFIHANIQDGKGERMSKSKGNGIDPVDIIDRYGTDALRYVLCDMQSGTQDIRLPVQAISPFFDDEEKLIDLATAKHGRSIFTYICPFTGKEFDVLGTMEELPRARLTSDRFEMGRAFCTKLWNAARFAFMNLGDDEKSNGGEFKPLGKQDLEEEDLWILSRLDLAMDELNTHLEGYNPSAAVGRAREFFWNDFCDWYIELVKNRLKDSDSAPTARRVLAYVLDQVFRMFHPFVPFITEELWRLLNERCPDRGMDSRLDCPELLMSASWPKPGKWRDTDVEDRFELLKSVVRAIRDVRARYGVAPRKALKVLVKVSGTEAETLKGLSRHLESQAVLEGVEFDGNASRPRTAATAMAAGLEIYVDGVLDPDKERKRLLDSREKLEKLAARSEKKLANARFVANAPAEVVEKERSRLAETRKQLEAVEAGLKDLM